MGQSEEDSLSSEKMISVTFLNIEKFHEKVIIHYYYKESLQWAFIRNDSDLIDRLFHGTVINMILYTLQWNNSQVYEAFLMIAENDLLPVDLIALLRKKTPANRTPFGFISEPVENTGQYYCLLKEKYGGILFCTGKYRIDDEQGSCLEFDDEWNIANGLIENYFLYQNWAQCPVNKWDYTHFSLSDLIEYLSIENLTREYRDMIARNNVLEYFYSDDWSPDFYRTQAKLGFIAITQKRCNKLQLLPELQSAYALLDWENLVIAKKVHKILNSRRMKEENIRLKINSDPEVVLKNLSSTWGETSWLKPRYEQLIRKLASLDEKEKDSNFRIWGVTLTVDDDQKPIAGELGYSIGKTYTSLTGFFKRNLKEHNNFGKLQMVMLAHILKDAGILFWNLGHPYMKYKTDLGAKIVPRLEFLKRWDEAVKGDSVDLHRI